MRLDQGQAGALFSDVETLVRKIAGDILRQDAGALYLSSAEDFSAFQIFAPLDL